MFLSFRMCCLLFVCYGVFSLLFLCVACCALFADRRFVGVRGLMLLFVVCCCVLLYVACCWLLGGVC